MQRLNRVLKNDDFSKIIKQGKKIKSNFFNIYFLQPEFPRYRIGISVSKKISKSAVVRNKIRRRIAAILNLKFDKTIILDLIIIPNRNVLDLSYIELENELVITLEKLYKNYRKDTSGQKV